MKCLFPQTKTRKIKGSLFEYQHACGQCMACRITRAQKWKLRLILESFLHQQSVFVTLTVANNGAKTKDIQFHEKNRDNHSPTHSVEKSQIQLFNKRLRKNTGIKYRFYAVGEYGSDSEREHYHLMLFGYPLEFEQEIRNAWPYGTVQVDEFTPERAGYIAGYVTKKLQKAGDDDTGREPEFALMSRNPGIGADYSFNVAETLEKHNIQFDPENMDVLRYKGSILPLDDFMKDKIHKQFYKMSKWERDTLTMSNEEIEQWEYAEELSKAFKQNMKYNYKRNNSDAEEEKRALSERKTRQYHSRRKPREPK